MRLRLMMEDLMEVEEWIKYLMNCLWWMVCGVGEMKKEERKRRERGGGGGIYTPRVRKWSGSTFDLGCP